MHSVLATTLALALAACTGPTFEYVPHADAETIANIDRGVLFIDARWSLPSLHARGELERVIADLPVELVIADHDGSPALASHPALEGRLHGAGETVWIRDGQICLVCTEASCVAQGVALVSPFDMRSYASC